MFINGFPSPPGGKRGSVPLPSYSEPWQGHTNFLAPWYSVYCITWYTVHAI